MRVLFDRNVEPRYIEAIAAISGITVERADDHLPQTAPDQRIAALAERQGWVVFSRDDDFFKKARHREIGLLFFSKQHNTRASEIATAVERIDDAYNDYTEIKEGLPVNGCNTTMDDSHHRDDLPKGHARLALREGDVTHIIQGPSEDVEQRLWEEVADEFGLSVEEMSPAVDCPMPDSDEGLVPAEEFYNSGE